MSVQIPTGLKPLVRGMLEEAAADLGVREQGGANRGKRVEEYLKSIGLGPGYAYCAAAVNLWIQEAANRLKLSDPWPNYGYCPDIDKWAKKRGILVDNPSAGDIFLVYGKSPQGFRARHTGVVLSARSGDVDTIEANTNIDGSAEGIGVFKRARTRSSKLKFVRLSDLTEANVLEDPQSTGWKLLIGDDKKPVMDRGASVRCPIRQGHAWAPVRPFLEALGFGRAIRWDEAEQAFWVGEDELTVDLAMIGDRMHAPIRDLAAFGGLRVVPDGPTQQIRVVR